MNIELTDDRLDLVVTLAKYFKCSPFEFIGKSDEFLGRIYESIERCKFINSEDN